VISNASDVEIKIMDDIAGPPPAGSLLSRNDRLHLLYMITVMNRMGDVAKAQGARDDILKALEGRSFTPDQLAEAWRQNKTPIEFVNALCVHPSMKPNYLD